MLIIIMLMVVILVCIGLIISQGYQIKDVPIYDKKGKATDRFDYFSKEDQSLIRKKTHRDYISSYDEFPCRYERKIVKNDYGVDFETFGAGTPLGVAIVAGLALISCSMCALINHTTNRRQKLYTEYQMRINNLKEEETTIDNYLVGEYVIDITPSASSYHVVVDKSFEIKESITNYNKAVNELKAELYIRKVKCENPWTSWLYSDGPEKVEGYNKSATIYTDILGTTLRTYEIKKV